MGASRAQHEGWTAEQWAENAAYWNAEAMRKHDAIGTLEREIAEARQQLEGAVEAIKALPERVNSPGPDPRESAYAHGYRTAVADALEALVGGR